MATSGPGVLRSSGFPPPSTRTVALSATRTLRTPVLVTTESRRPSTLSTSPLTVGEAAGLAAGAGLAAVAGLGAAAAGEAAGEAGAAVVGLAASVGFGAAVGAAGGALPPQAVSSMAVVMSATLRERRGADPSMRGLHQSGPSAHLRGARRDGRQASLRHTGSQRAHMCP